MCVISYPLNEARQGDRHLPLPRVSAALLSRELGWQVLGDPGGGNCCLIAILIRNHYVSLSPARWALRYYVI